MNRLKQIALHIMLLLPLGIAAAEPVAPIDTLVDEATKDSSLYTRRNVASGFNSLDYLLEDRYIAHGDQFTKRWNDHLFIEAGLGAEHIIAPTDDYKFTPVTSAKLSFGKQLNERNTIRLSAFGGFAYQKEENFYMVKMGGKIDHLFDLSSYFNGYDPTRRISISTLLGAGVVYSKFADNSGYKYSSDAAFEGHMGLQFKLFTGPQGYVNFEPYVGVATDAMDVSEQRNWRKYDGFFGANLTYVYFLHNNLSPEARERYLTKRKLSDDITKDSILYSWQKPLFVEISNSFHAPRSGEMAISESMGLGYSFAIGKWLSPAIALRATIGSQNITSSIEEGKLGGQSYTQYNYANYLSGKLEALFNPFGLVRHYNWESRFGAYAVLGLEMGKVWKEHEDINKMMQGYTAGLHLWARLSEGLHLFVEPRLEHVIYHSANKTAPNNVRYGDDFTSLNVGISINTRQRKFEDWGIYEELDHVQFMNRFVVGAGGGLNHLQTVNQLNKALKLGYNVQGFIEYHLNDIHAARLSGEMTMHPLDFISKTESKVDYRKHWAAYGSLDYMVCLTNLMNGTNPDGRRFEAFAFAGPTAFFSYSNGKVIGPKLTYNFGAKLLFKVNKHIGIHLTPTFYGVTKEVREASYPYINLNKVSLIETINLGAQYTFKLW